MLVQMFCGTCLVLVTFLIQALILDQLMKSLEKIGPFMFQRFHSTWKIPLSTFVGLGVLMAHTIQIFIWAFVYLEIDALHDFEEALYFSTSTFTTVGYGDVILDKDWRLLSAFQSANGFILFGWSTAFIFEVMSKLYDQRKIPTRGTKT